MKTKRKGSASRLQGPACAGMEVNDWANLQWPQRFGMFGLCRNRTCDLMEEHLVLSHNRFGARSKEERMEYNKYVKAKVETHQFPHILEDIIRRILSKLPVKSLL